MLTYILMGAGLALLGVGSTWYGLRAVAVRVRETAALRARGLWTLLRAWLQPLGCTSMGVGFVLLGGVVLLFLYLALTIAPVHAPPSVGMITAVALVIRDVATVLLGFGTVLWLVGGMASAVWDDATPDVMGHEAVHHVPGPVRHREGSEENGQAPRAVSHRRPIVEFGDIAWLFRASLFTASLIGIVNLIPDIVLGRVTVESLGRLVLNVLGFAVALTTVFTVLIAIAGVLSWRDRAKGRRMRQGSGRHHP